MVGAGTLRLEYLSRHREKDTRKMKRQTQRERLKEYEMTDTSKMKHEYKLSLGV